MVDVILANGGILDKYIGDCIMALFGAPFAGEHDADNSVRAANLMVTTLRALNARRVAAGKLPIHVGVGLNTGEGVLGSIGSPKRMEYTVIGDNVNLASRVEGACKKYGVQILLTEFTLAELQQPTRVRRIDQLRVKGKTQPVAIYEALDHHTDETFPGLDAFLPVWQSAMDAYTAGKWAEARNAFASVLDLRPGDPPAVLYAARCEHFLTNSPAPDWDGVWEMTEK
jgi:adenylate cyclase